MSAAHYPIYSDHCLCPISARYAWFFVAMYPLGIPSVGAILLWTNRAAIVKYLHQCEERENSSAEVVIKADEQAFDGDGQTIYRFKGIFVPFKANYYWWGIGDQMNRLLLTGFAVLFEPGSMMQVHCRVYSCTACVDEIPLALFPSLCCRLRWRLCSALLFYFSKSPINRTSTRTTTSCQQTSTCRLS